MGLAGIFALLPLSVLGSKDVPWVPTRPTLVREVLRLADVGPGDVFYDLGCGDGRVAVEAAKAGALAVCVELRRDLARRAARRARAEGVADKVIIVQGDMFEVNLSKATVVYMYLLTRVNAQLRPKLEVELAEGARIVTLDFPVPGWRPVAMQVHYTGGLERTLYLYVRGLSDSHRGPAAMGSS